MNTLFKKDLRENFKLALIGAAILSLLMTMGYQDCQSALKQLVSYGNGTMVSNLNPLFNPGIRELVTFFCAIFGGLLGWLQTRNEAHRDLWAFLIHRPLTRTQIFQGKTLAGMILYALGAGLPLLGLILVVATPGHIPMPFEWAMALPLAAMFLTGFAYYFAGLLIGLRQARWYGSRCFGIGAAALASVASFNAGEFWQALLATAIATTILALAAWGAYQSGGFYRGQPRPGQAALSLAMASGGLVVVFLAIALLEIAFHGNIFQSDYTNRQYTMLRSGQIGVETWQNNDWKSIQDLDGKPLLNLKTGQPMTRKDLDTQRSYGTTVNTRADQLNAHYDTYHSPFRFFSLWVVQDKKLWLVDRYGRLVAYDGYTRKMIHELQPRDADGAIDPEGFKRPYSTYGGDYYYNNPNSDPPSDLATSRAMYKIDFEAVSIKRIFTADTNDEILGYAGINENYRGADTITVATRHTVQLLTPEGVSYFKTPYEPAAEKYPSVAVHHLDGDQLALWYSPHDITLPQHIVRPAYPTQTAQAQDLPSLYVEYPQSLANKLESTVIPPGLLIVAYVTECFEPHIHPPVLFKLEFFLSCGWSVVCVFIGLGMLSRYNFSARPKIVWSIFISLLGIPGLIALFVAEEWPMRETCPKCGRLRAVDHTQCEYCAAEFPAPEKNGTEIFEPLLTVTK